MMQDNGFKESMSLIPILLLLSSTLVWGQKTITGNIISEDNEPLVGATVIELGTDNGTVTDLDGSYSITVADDASIQYSYTGYQTQVIPVAEQTTINLTMSVGIALDEVVVTGYGSQKKKGFDGSHCKSNRKGIRAGRQ